MSPFAIALQRLFDETTVFNHEGWAKLCGTSNTQLDKWLKDRDIPTPHHLTMIWLTLQTSSAVPSEPFEAFLTIAHLRATEVSPHGKRMLPTVWEYMERPELSELSSKLAKLTPEEQGKLLEEMFPPDVNSIPS